MTLFILQHMELLKIFTIINSPDTFDLFYPKTFSNEKFPWEWAATNICVCDILQKNNFVVLWFLIFVSHVQDIHSVLEKY